MGKKQLKMTEPRKFFDIVKIRGTGVEDNERIYKGG